MLFAAVIMPAAALAQAPPASKSPSAGTSGPPQSRNCANPTPPAASGKRGDADVAKPDGSNLSQKLAQSNGVLCPPKEVDPGMRAPTPPVGRMPVIKPPGTPGSPDQSVQPK
jgi:hypothetical protein